MLDVSFAVFACFVDGMFIMFYTAGWASRDCPIGSPETCIDGWQDSDVALNICFGLYATCQMALCMSISLGFQGQGHILRNERRGLPGENMRLWPRIMGCHSILRMGWLTFVGEWRYLALVMVVLHAMAAFVGSRQRRCFVSAAKSLHRWPTREAVCETLFESWVDGEWAADIV